jgi:hypothetical protein
MVAGVQLTSIGSLSLADWPRLVAAGAGLAAGLSAVGFMIFTTSRLLTDEWITLAQLELEEFKHQLRRPARRSARQAQRPSSTASTRNSRAIKDELYGDVASSISDLYRRLIKANDQARDSADPRIPRPPPASATPWTRSWQPRTTPTPAPSSRPCAAASARPGRCSPPASLTGAPHPMAAPLDQPRNGSGKTGLRRQDIDHVHAENGIGRSLLASQPPKLFTGQRPVNRRVSSEAERGRRIDRPVRARRRIRIRPYVRIKPVFVTRIRTAVEFYPQRDGKSLPLGWISQAQDDPDRRRPENHLILTVFRLIRHVSRSLRGPDPHPRL